MQKFLKALCAVFLLTSLGCTNKPSEPTPTQTAKPAEPTVAPLAEDQQGQLKAGTIYSPTLKLDWNYTIYLPKDFDEQKDNTLDVMYLLHGAGGNHRNLVERFPIKDQLDELIHDGKMHPTVAIFVDGFNSFYVNGPAFQMEDAIVNDLIPTMEKKYNLTINRDQRSIGGISMGGYGAAFLAIKHPDLFSNAILISPAIWYEVTPTTPTGDWHVFTDDSGNFSQDVWMKSHPVTFFEEYKKKDLPVNFYVISGEKDQVVPISEVDHFVEDLQKVANVKYEKSPDGIHAWTYWKDATKKALEEYNK